MAKMQELGDVVRRLWNRENLKYISADIPGFICGLAAATAATVELRESGFSDSSNALLTLGAKCAAFYAANITSYLAIHYREYSSGKKEPWKDVKALTHSNLHGSGAALFLKGLGHYAVLTTGLIPYYLGPLVVYPIVGSFATAYRHWKNYNSGLIRLLPAKEEQKKNNKTST